MRRRQLVSWLMALAIAGVALRSGADMSDLLVLAPALLAWTLLCNGRFPGEQRLLARRSGAAGARVRASATAWAVTVNRAVASMLDRAPRSLRGPPAACT